MVPQSAKHACRKALIIPKAHDQPLRRCAQEMLQCGQILNNRQVQVAGVKCYLGVIHIKLQQRPPQQWIGALWRTKMAKPGSIQGNPPSGEPAKHTQHDAEIDFFRAPPDGQILQRCP
ncbi:hypothetical protein D9M69_671340 [compost metagenome]